MAASRTVLAHFLIYHPCFSLNLFRAQKALACGEGKSSPLGLPCHNFLTGIPV